jgi:pimeloyl-ACP methyl ester carboxylesterase
MSHWVYAKVALLAGGAAALAIFAVPRMLAVLRARRMSEGCPDEGVVIFVESLRWLGVRWGRCETEAGLRRARFRGAFRFWDWNPTWRALLVLPTIAARAFLEAEAQRLADHLAELRKSHSDLPIHLIGYSCGGYIAIRALELLPDDVRVESCTLLAAAFSPWRDLNLAARRVSGQLVVNSSPFDVIVGLGTIFVGTADRVFAPSIGTLGYRGRHCEKLKQVRWRPGFIRLGYWGGHMSPSAERFIAECIVPAAGIR